MKTLIGMMAACVIGITNSEAQTLTKREIRNFYGEYTGQVSGIAGVSGGASLAVAFETTVVVNQRTRLLAPVQIGGLHSQSAHLLVFRKPTGNRFRARFAGLYTGTSTNPATMLPEPVSGTRVMAIRDRGTARKPRYVMRFSDDLREGGYSAQNISGTLVK